MTDQPDEIELVYGYLTVRLGKNFRNGGSPELGERIIAAIDLFEELWPAETKRWTDRFATAEENPDRKDSDGKEPRSSPTIPVYAMKEAD
jgi:hypothetical protein